MRTVVIPLAFGTSRNEFESPGLLHFRGYVCLLITKFLVTETLYHPMKVLLYPGWCD